MRCPSVAVLWAMRVAASQPKHLGVGRTPGRLRGSGVSHHVQPLYVYPHGLGETMGELIIEPHGDKA